MKEKLLDIIRISTRLPRKLLDKILFNFYLKRNNNWDILDQFKNRPVLVVGNGPSLNSTPLHSIKDEIVSIGMNKINLIYKKSKWRPEIIACVNGLVIRQNRDYFNKTKAVLVVPVKAYYLGVKPRKNIIYINLTDKEKIEVNIQKEVSAGCTVTFIALQIAAYLQPKSVSIVGVDHNFVYDKGQDHEIKKLEGDDLNHFSKDYFKNHYWGIPNLRGSERLYQLSKTYFESKEVPIVDYTVEGKLQIFDKGDIEELINE
ncbi:6-hydroxymethylpterin diphosphokinase MptE-like protein [Winogradskyella sp.]|uniref:6-hydroxymethylpterin diphosphokinase MptE-like protein n=1 Tax=Winogradskyella sp. TaxID=1883156 RepID=UPI003516A8F6